MKDTAALKAMLRFFFFFFICHRSRSSRLGVGTRENCCALDASGSVVGARKERLVTLM